MSTESHEEFVGVTKTYVHWVKLGRSSRKHLFALKHLAAFPHAACDIGAYQSRLEAREAPSERARSFAQAIWGWHRSPSPQSVEAMTFSRPTFRANRSTRLATSSGCSTSTVEWVTHPGARILPAGSFT